MPTLSSATVNVREGGASPSFVDLPLLPFAHPTLSTDPLLQSVGAPENQRLTIHSHSGRAGDPYLLLPSLSGTSPSTEVVGVPVPIVFDAVTALWAANPGLPPFVGLAGSLDPTGSADAGVLLEGLPLPPSLIGLELSLAAIVDDVDPASTNAVTIPFLP